MKKYIRHQPIISRNADSDFDEDHWLHRFEQSLLKDAVQPRNQNENIYDQINSIVNKKSKFKSVEEAVSDMMRRSGATAFLEKQSKDVSNKKIAQAQSKVDASTPDVIKKCPEVMKTLENHIKDSKGNLSIPAIIDRIRSIHQQDIADATDWEDDKLLKLVAQLNLEAKKSHFGEENYADLGKRDNLADSEVDPSNTDAFYILNPAK